MIDKFTHEPLPAINKIQIGDKTYSLPTADLNTLTLEKNSVLIVKIPNDGSYDMSMVQTFYDDLKNKFPCHSICNML